MIANIIIGILIVIIIGLAIAIHGLFTAKNECPRCKSYKWTPWIADFKSLDIGKEHRKCSCGYTQERWPLSVKNWKES